MNMNTSFYIWIISWYSWVNVDAKNMECIKSDNVLDQLIRRENYDMANRPCNNGDPVVVKIGLYIVSINNFEESDMEFDIQIYFRQQWVDERLKYSGLNMSYDEQYIEMLPEDITKKIWLPDAYFQNEKSGRRHTIMKDNQFVRLFPDGTIMFSTRLTLTLSCPMDFKRFPLDQQTCDIIILSYSHTTKQLVLDWMTNKSDTSVYFNKLTLPQFFVEEIETLRRVDAYTVGNFTVLTCHINFRRRLSFYLTHNYIPSLLVTSISWLSFWIDRRSVPARVGIGITTILAMTTLIIGIGQQGLPVVSYIKAIDWYYIGCFTFVFAALCEFAIVNYFDVEHRKEIEKHRVEQLRYETTEVTEDDECQDWRIKYGLDVTLSSCTKDRHLTSVHFTKESPLSDAIENNVRKIYPLLFIAFNITYWTTYLNTVTHTNNIF